MKKVAIISLVISILSLAMVAFLYMPKFKKSPSLDSLDVYQKKIVELFPELEDAVYIDSAQYYSYYLHSLVNPTYTYSVLNNVPIVGFFDNGETERELRDYEYFNSQKGMCYLISFRKMDPKHELSIDDVSEFDNYKLSRISTYKCNELDIFKTIVERDTLVKLSYNYEVNLYSPGEFYRRHFFYSLKKENGDVSRFVEYDWSLNFDERSLNTIEIASRIPEKFTVDIATKYDDKLKLSLPVFDGKTIELIINNKDKRYKTVAIVSDGNNISENCSDKMPNEISIRNLCRFTLIAPFEKCNLKINVSYENYVDSPRFPIIDIENDIVQLMQCLNIW